MKFEKYYLCTKSFPPRNRIMRYIIGVDKNSIWRVMIHENSLNDWLLLTSTHPYLFPDTRVELLENEIEMMSMNI